MGMMRFQQQIGDIIIIIDAQSSPDSLNFYLIPNHFCKVIIVLIKGVCGLSADNMLHYNYALTCMCIMATQQLHYHCIACTISYA